MNRPGRAAGFLLQAGWLTAVHAAAQTPRAVAQPDAVAQTPDAVAAAERLGRVHFTISCSPRAQAGFDHALALLHHMTYP